jgi:hypothetical protein
MRMSEQFAYRAFLLVVFGGLALMTLGLAVIWALLIRRNRRDRRRDGRPTIRG